MNSGHEKRSGVILQPSESANRDARAYLFKGMDLHLVIRTSSNCNLDLDLEALLASESKKNDSVAEDPACLVGVPREELAYVCNRYLAFVNHSWNAVVSSYYDLRIECL